MFLGSLAFPALIGRSLPFLFRGFNLPSDALEPFVVGGALSVGLVLLTLFGRWWDG